MPEDCNPVVGCTHFLLTSEKGCQTNWHQDYPSTGVGYTVISERGGKAFHLLKSTPNNLKIYNAYLKMPNKR
jgi:hypothetical protein